MAEDREDRSYGPANSDPCLKNRICLTHGLLPRLRHALHRYRFGLAAFLIPPGIRAIPEIILGPYPVGWDTIAFYVPTFWTGQREKRASWKCWGQRR